MPTSPIITDGESADTDASQPPRSPALPSDAALTAAPRASDRPPISAAVRASAPSSQSGVDLAVVLAGCLVFALVLFLPQVLNDADTLWQISTGIWILQHHAIPVIDPFSFTAGNRPWFAHEWLAEVMMGLAFRAGGMQGIMVLTAGASGLTAAVLLHYLQRFLPRTHAIVALTFALGMAAPSLLARPHLLAWPCLALWCGGLVTARANRVAPSIRLLPVMLLWVNLHGSFMLGLVLPIAFMLEALFDPGAIRAQVLKAWAGFMAAAWAVALLNPDLLAGVLFPFHLMNMQSLAWLHEWTPTDFTHPPPLEVIILGGLALGFTGKVRLPPMRLVLFLGLVHAALAHGRNQQLLGIIGALVVAEPLAQCLAPGGVSASGAASRGWVAGAVSIAVLALGLRVALPLSPDRTNATFAAILDRIPASLRAQPVLNDYRFGGNLIFAGVRPFIDGRADLYGDAFLANYFNIVLPNRTVLDQTLSKYGIAWTIFPATAPIVQLLDAEQGWRRIVEAGSIVIQARQDPSPR